MHFNKLPTTIDDQITLLIGRGMQGDQSPMRRWLETVGYYRLSAYWLPFEIPAADGQTRSKQFATDLQFVTIVDIYVFDRKLRLLVKGSDRAHRDYVRPPEGLAPRGNALPNRLLLRTRTGSHRALLAVISGA